MSEFCPNCGCEKTRLGYNMAEYPEIWQSEYCLRCGEVVAVADNSPFIHVLHEMAVYK
jgi:transcription initiation factor IIE alpha subunit